MPVIQPAAFIDQIALHHGDMGRGSSKGSKAQQKEIGSDFAQRIDGWAADIGRRDWIVMIIDSAAEFTLHLPFSPKMIEITLKLIARFYVCQDFVKLANREYASRRIDEWRFLVAKSIAEWMREGESLYVTALKEFEEMDAQLQQLEKQLAQKQDEVNQIAQVIGKPLVEGNRRLTAQLVDDHGPLSVPTSSTTIARALSGRNINR
jgi:hypothetical protein